MDAVVIGGGIGGLAAAIALSRAGIEVAVYERAPQIREFGVGLDATGEAEILRNDLYDMDPLPRRPPGAVGAPVARALRDRLLARLPSRLRLSELAWLCTFDP